MPQRLSILVINLSEAKERWIQIQKEIRSEFSDAHGPIVRMDAVDGVRWMQTTDEETRQKAISMYSMWRLKFPELACDVRHINSIVFRFKKNRTLCDVFRLSVVRCNRRVV